MGSCVFEKTSKIEAPIAQVFQWHSRPGAIERYTPPWDPIKVISRTGGIEAGAEIKIRMKAGPVPYTWHAKHTDFVQNKMFRDIQVRGPFLKWNHTHEFIKLGDQGCYLKDHIEFKLPPHPLRGSISNKIVLKKLKPIFDYRHRILKQDMALQSQYPMTKSKTILISGASGSIGTALIPFLTTAGCRIKKLVRRMPESADEIFWNPIKGEIDRAALEGIDAVIHLAGENIGQGKWTKEKKDRIIASRVLGTRTLVNAVINLKQQPKVFLNASAIGYYGNRSDTILVEKNSPGQDFISDVCSKWENESIPAEKAGMRTANLRIGVVLDPRGGALSRMLPVFKTGLGTTLGTGKQYVSWISLDDTIGSLYTVLNNPEISGPINIVSPNPLRGEELSKTLAKVISTKFITKIPEKAIRLTFGQMGEELLLSSTRVKPEVLLNSGFNFIYPELEDYLRHILGKKE